MGELRRAIILLVYFEAMDDWLLTCRDLWKSSELFGGMDRFACLDSHGFRYPETIGHDFLDALKIHRGKGFGFPVRPFFDLQRRLVSDDMWYGSATCNAADIFARPC